jgi:hypothetical protein
MTTAAIRLRSRCRLSVRHSFRTEAAGALTLYGLYELARGLQIEYLNGHGTGRYRGNRRTEQIGCLVLGRG